MAKDNVVPWRVSQSENLHVRRSSVNFNFEHKKSSDCDDTTRFSGLNSQLKLDFYRG